MVRRSVFKRATVFRTDGAPKWIDEGIFFRMYSMVYDKARATLRNGINVAVCVIATSFSRIFETNDEQHTEP